ncbi:MAG: LysR substrate-binding domain-containing protein [Solirubrobacteraceae bacterium]
MAHAEAILGRVDAAQAELRDLAAVRAGRLRVAVFPTAGAAFMPAAIATFATRHPGVELRTIEEETDEALILLDRREVDLVIGYDFDGAAHPTSDVSRTRLVEDQMRLVLPRGHRLATGRRLSLADLSHESWIGSHPHRPCSDALASVCATAGFTPEVVYRSDDYATIHELVAAGVGIAMVPDLASDRSYQNVVYRDTVRPSLPARHVFAAAVADGAPAAAAMVGVLRSLTAPSTLNASPDTDKSRT